MNKRLRKKKHREFIQDLLSNLSQNTAWRNALFATAETAPLQVSGELLDSLPAYLVRAIRGRGLHMLCFPGHVSRLCRGLGVFVLRCMRRPFPQCVSIRVTRITNNFAFGSPPHNHSLSLSILFLLAKSIVSRKNTVYFT